MVQVVAEVRAHRNVRPRERAGRDIGLNDELSVLKERCLVLGQEKVEARLVIQAESVLRQILLDVELVPAADDGRATDGARTSPQTCAMIGAAGRARRRRARRGWAGEN